MFRRSCESKLCHFANGNVSVVTRYDNCTIRLGLWPWLLVGTGVGPSKPPSRRYGFAGAMKKVSQAPHRCPGRSLLAGGKASAPFKSRFKSVDLNPLYPECASTDNRCTILGFLHEKRQKLKNCKKKNIPRHCLMKLHTKCH